MALLGIELIGLKRMGDFVIEKAIPAGVRQKGLIISAPPKFQFALQNRWLQFPLKQMLFARIGKPKPIKLFLNWFSAIY